MVEVIRKGWSKAPTGTREGPPSGVDARAAGGLVQPARVNAPEATVVDRSLAKKETRSLSADICGVRSGVRRADRPFFCLGLLGIRQAYLDIRGAPHRGWGAVLAAIWDAGKLGRRLAGS